MPGERRAARASRPPRRVSGPAGGKATIRASRAATGSRAKGVPTASRGNGAATAAVPTRGTTTARARRAPTAPRASRMPRAMVAGAGGALAAAVALPLPVPRRLRPVPRRERAPKTGTGFFPRIGAFVVALPDHPWLDKVVRGRVWIPVLGVLLAGIVAAQVEILKLGATMGRSLEQTTTLTTQNEELRYSVASLSDDQRIERLATSMGMVLPPPGAVGYLGANQRADVSRALGNIHAPDATAFMALSPTNGALVTGPGTSMLPAPPGVLAQAGTPGSATPTNTPSPTSTVPSAGGATSGGTATTTGSMSAGSTTATTTGATSGAAAGTPTDTTSTSAATTAQQTPTYSQSSTTATQSPTTTSQAATTGTESGSQAPATGAAAIQPAGGTQQSSGG